MGTGCESRVRRSWWRGLAGLFFGTIEARRQTGLPVLVWLYSMAMRCFLLRTLGALHGSAGRGMWLYSSE